MNLNQEISFADIKRLLDRTKAAVPSRAPRAPKKREEREEHRELVGLKVGASKLAAAHVVNNGSAQLQQLVCDPMEAGVVVNGELRDPEALAEALSDFFTKHNLPRNHVRLGVANSRIGVRWFEIGGVEDEEQLENAVRFRAQEILPIPLEEAVMDYHVLERSEDDAGHSVWKILLVVAHRQLIDSYVDACRRAGIELVGIDLEAFALLRALGTPDGQQSIGEGALIGVSLGHDRSTFAVSDGKTCEFARVLNWGGSTLTTAIARTLGIAPAEAETIKRNLSLADGATTDGSLTDEETQKALSSVRTELHSFAHELVSSLQFYQSQPKSLPISEIVLTGGTASLPGLDAELQRLVGVRVRVGDPLGRVELAPSVTPVEPSGAVTVAVGLGIED